MQTSSLKKIGKRILQIGLPIAVLGFFLKFIVGQWSQLVAHPFQWDPWLIGLAFVGFLLQELSYGLIWQGVLQRLGSRIDLRTSLRIYLASEFVRYIPGNVWHVLARILWVGKYDVSRPIAFTSMTIELITKLAAGAFIFACSLLFWGSLGTVHTLLVGKSFLAVLGVLLLLALLIFLHPRILGGLLNTALRVLKREPIVLTLRYSDILLIAGAWCISWIIAGSAFYILTLALWPSLPIAALPICIGIYAIAWDIGFVSFITPSGLGFREVLLKVFFVLALSTLPLALGPIIAILSRLISTLAELCMRKRCLSRRAKQMQAMQQEQRMDATTQSLSKEVPYVNNESWRKRVSILLNRLYLYPAPEPMSRTPMFWIATGLVALFALSFSIFFILFNTAQHDAFLTHGEDLGIMDQAIWSIWHGQVLHQSICNPISDTNCYGNLNLSGIPRFAIHFEPILFLISLFYLVIPNPKTLQVIQTVVVATGAFPAFWLARLRLRSELASVAIAALYLLYPALQWATIFDFHAVTLTASLLLFVLYFMYTRRTVLLFVFAILAMACKEEIPIVVALYGLWSIVFQRRWRSGLALMLIAAVWTGVGLYVVHISSPTGHSLLTSRYSYLGSGPLQIVKNILFHPTNIIKEHVLEHNHLIYIRTLFAPTAYLALLAPWIWVLALPTLAINLLSTSASQYSGLYQYDAEMIPVLIFSTIEALVLIVWLVQKMLDGVRVQWERRNGAIAFPARRADWVAHSGILFALLCLILFAVYHADYERGTAPFSQEFKWPKQYTHYAFAQPIIDMIPPTASVSAQSNLIPHISHRSHIYQFPYGDTAADYIFLDTTSDVTPFYGSNDYINEAKSVLLSGKYGIVAAHDGYLLLKRGLPAPGVSALSPMQPTTSGSNSLVLPNLPESFCSYINVAQKWIKNPMDVAFTDPKTSQATMDLIGYNVDAPKPFSVSSDSMTVTTYWKVATPLSMPLQVVTFMTDKNGNEYQGTTDFPAVSWCQTHTLKPGTLIRLTSRLFNVEANRVPVGIAHVSIALVPLLQNGNTIMDVDVRLPLHVVHIPANVSLVQNRKAVQIVAIHTVP